MQLLGCVNAHFEILGHALKKTLNVFRPENTSRYVKAASTRLTIFDSHASRAYFIKDKVAVFYKLKLHPTSFWGGRDYNRYVKKI